MTGSLYYYYIVIIIIIIRTLGVPTSGRLMEVGSSIEVRHKTARSLAEKHHFILKQTRHKRSITGPQSRRHLLSQTVFSFIIFLK